MTAASSIEGQARDREIARLKRAAYRWVALLALVMTAACAWPFVSAALRIDPMSVQLAMWAGFLPIVLIVLIVATAMAARPIQRRTGYAGEKMLFVAWFYLIFAVLFPIGIMALVVAIARFTGRIFGSTIYSMDSEGRAIPGTERYHPPAHLKQGESYPLGFVYLAMAVLWPALAFAAIGPVAGWELPPYMEAEEALSAEAGLFRPGIQYYLDKRVREMMETAEERPSTAHPPPTGAPRPRLRRQPASAPTQRPSPTPAPTAPCVCASGDVLCHMRCAQKR
jgi:hypothetical protein